MATLRPLPDEADRRTVIERNDSVGRTVGILSDAWSFLVLREMYLGARRFDQIYAVLKLPRTTLSERLGRLADSGIVRRVPYSQKPPRFEYRLTAMGLDLYLVMLALLRFGDDWLSADRPPPLHLVHHRCGHRFNPLSVCSHCRGELSATRVAYRDGPGAGTTTVPVGRQLRRSADLGQFERGRPSSVSRTLQIIGDRWSFLIIREAFFGVKRFDDLQLRLGVASNILAERLARFIEQGVLHRIKYQDLPERFEYRLTAMGKALYLPLIEMLRWGDRWLARGRPPLILTHTACGHDFLPQLVCDQCRVAIDPHDVRYKLNYVPTPEAALAPAALGDS